jgi:hypothetical protein
MLARVGPLAVALGVLAAIGCGGGDRDGDGGRSALPRGDGRVELDPADFTTRIDNPYWPGTPGSRWIHRETAADGTKQRVEVTVTHSIKRVAGVRARVVHDVVTQRGALVENTYDWYAQDRAGNVWYLGESTREYENGKLASTEGSWGGRHRWRPGRRRHAGGAARRHELPAGAVRRPRGGPRMDPQPRRTGGGSVRPLPARPHDEDYTPLEPAVLEHKLYARGVGPVMVLSLSGGGGSEELIRFHSPR